jgi:hypothetical protein
VAGWHQTPKMRFDDDGDVDMEQAEALQEKRTKLDTPVAADAEDEVMADDEPTKEISAPVEKDCGFCGLVYLE